METYPNDLIGGEIVPPLVIRDEYVITGNHKGTIYVESGVLNIDGSHEGTVNLLPGAAMRIKGEQYGTVNIGPGASVVVFGILDGTVNIQKDGSLTVEEGGKFAGNLFNDGVMCLRGVYGGFVNGDGKIKVEGKGEIKKPVIRDRIIYFDW